MSGEINHETAPLQSSIDRQLRTVDALTNDDLRAESLLPDWTRGHVLTHLARSADSRTRLLAAARTGAIGRQYPSEDARARAIDTGATRPTTTIRADLRQSLDRLLAAIYQHPADKWNAPGEWLGGGLRPVHGVITSMRREIEYHHVDLDADYRPADWPDDFVDTQLSSVTDSMRQRPDAPSITILLANRILRIGDGTGATVTGSHSELLAWLAGRSAGEHLHIAPPGPLPTPPPLA